jgi:hypothetical protein
MFNVFISMTNCGHSRRMFLKLSSQRVLACVSLNLRVTRIRVNGTFSVLYVFMDRIMIGGIHVYRLGLAPQPVRERH